MVAFALALMWFGSFTLLAAGCRTPRDGFTDAAPTQDLGHELSTSGSVEQSVIDRTNAERKRAGVRPLAPDARLAEAAQRHATNMAKRDKLSHELDGLSAAERAKAAGFAYRAVGENIAWNQPSPKAAVDDWMKSPGHRKNLLSDDFTHLGVGMAVNAKGEPYWVQVFGTPK